MSWQIWWLFVCGVFVICATPGPNMLHVMSRSQKFGYRRSMAAMVSKPSGGEEDFFLMNFSACLKLQKVSGNSG